MMTLVPVTSREFTGTAQHRITTKWKTRNVLIAIRFMSVGLLLQRSSYNLADRGVSGREIARRMPSGPAVNIPKCYRYEVMPSRGLRGLCTFGDSTGGSVTCRRVNPRSFEVNVNITGHYLKQMDDLREATLAQQVLPSWADDVESLAHERGA